NRYGVEVRIEHDGGPLEPRRDLREQLKPLASQRGFQEGEAGGVPPWAVEPLDDAAGDGVDYAPKDDRDRPRLPLEGNCRRRPIRQDDVGLEADHLPRERSYPIDVPAAPTKVDPHVAAIGPAQVPKRLRERRNQTLRRGSFVDRHEDANPPHPVPLLRAR